MFAGIGGFRAGLSLIDGYECVGHCEIEENANRSNRAIHALGLRLMAADDELKSGGAP